MRHEKIITEAVRQAQIICNNNGFKIGDVVAHWDEPLACELVEIRGDMGVIEYKDVKRVFPLSELFNPNVAMEIALKIQEGHN